MENVALQQEIREWKKLFADEVMPMLDLEKAEELQKKAKLIVQEKKLKPDPLNGDSGNDDGLADARFDCPARNGRA